MLEINSGGNYLGYTLTMARSNKTILGRYRHEADVGLSVKSRVEVLTSIGGDFIAVVNRFEVTGNSNTEPTTLTYGKVVPYQRPPAPVKRAAKRGKQGSIWVRTVYGWQEMTPEQERMWRQSQDERVDFARRLHSVAGGGY